MNWKCKYEKFLMMILWMCSHSVLLNTVWYCFWMSCFKTKNRFVFFCRTWKAKWFCHFIGINLSLYKKKKSKRIIIIFWLSCWFFSCLGDTVFCFRFHFGFFLYITESPPSYVCLLVSSNCHDIFFLHTHFLNIFFPKGSIIFIICFDLLYWCVSFQFDKLLFVKLF